MGALGASLPVKVTVSDRKLRTEHGARLVPGVNYDLADSGLGFGAHNTHTSPSYQDRVNGVHAFRCGCGQTLFVDVSA